jgi:glycine cleavage system H protein
MGAKRKEPREAATEGNTLPVSYRGWAVLPCNGLDKEAGALSREIAITLTRKGATIICPVLFGRSPSRYEKKLEGAKLLIIDGCKKECASKLAQEQGLKVVAKVNVKEKLKEMGLKSGKVPIPGRENLNALLAWSEKPREREVTQDASPAGDLFGGPVEFLEFMADKFVFKVPAAGYYFNENDCWARVEGGKARLGVSDYVQQSASDMVFFEPPEIDAEIGQFDEAGSLESTKTALDIISPFSGKVVAVNVELVEAPEIINEDPYVKGWVVELELVDFESDRELLMDCDGYFTYLKEKVARELHEKSSG